MTNLIDAKAAFAARARRTQHPPDGLADRIGRQTKVPLADRHVFARNLGKLAERLNPENPAAGVRTMFEAADRQSQREKRKRLVRLTGEPCPVATGKGDYEATPGHYLALAGAAGRILAEARGLDNPANDVREAIRILAAGSSFAPTYEPASLGEKNVLSLLDEFASAITKQVGE